MKRLEHKGNEPVPVGAVAVVSVGGFLSESAPTARVRLLKGMERLGESRDRRCVLLTLQQRMDLENGIGTLIHVLRCFTVREDGFGVPEHWNHGGSAWLDLDDFGGVLRQAKALGISVPTNMRRLLVWELVAEAYRQ